MENDLTVDKKPIPLYLSALLSSLFFTGSQLVPLLLGIGFLILCPLPLLWVYLQNSAKEGRQACILALIITLSLAYFNFGVIAGLPFSFFVALAIGAGEKISQRKSRLNALCWGAGCAAAVNLVYLAGVAWYGGQDIQTFWASHWVAEFSNWQPGLASDQLEDHADYLRQQLYLIGLVIFRLIVSISIINFAVIAWINVFFLHRLSVSRPTSRPMLYESLTAWRSPFPLVWVLIGSALLVWLSEGFIYWLALNLLILVFAVYWFHGLAVSAYFCDKKNVPIWLRIVFLLIMLLMIYFIGLIALLGLFDVWFNWRGIETETVR
jgi:uncharacterized protein YybS (DUF2232 family)